MLVRQATRYCEHIKARTYAMAPKAGMDLEAFGKAKFASGSPSKERGDCEFCCFSLI